MSILEITHIVLGASECKLPVTRMRSQVSKGEGGKVLERERAFGSQSHGSLRKIRRGVE
jgi:hypothetical protein